MSLPASAEFLRRVVSGKKASVLVFLLIACTGLMAGEQVGVRESAGRAAAQKTLEMIAAANKQQSAEDRIKLLREAEVLCKDPDLKNSELYPSLVIAYVDTGDLDSAKRTIEQMSASGAPGVYLTGALLSLSRGYVKAKQFTTAAQQLDPLVADLREAAVAKSGSSGRVQQSLIDALELYGEVHLELGDAKSAIGALQECQELRKARHLDSSALTWLNLARSHVKLGMPDQAIEEFSESYFLAAHRAEAIHRHIDVAGPATAGQYSGELEEMEGLVARAKEAMSPLYSAREKDQPLDAYLKQQLARYDTRLVDRALEKARVNKPAPQFSLATLVGGGVKLADLLGRVILLNFWDTSCKPCREEYPHLRHIQKEFQDAGVAVLMISLDTTVSDVKPFADKYGFTSQVLLKDDSVMSAYEVGPIPHTVLIDQTGRIRFGEVGFTLDSPELFRAEIEMLLNERPTRAALLQNQN